MADPKYIGLAEKLRQAILRGEYIEGSRLPSENQLTESTGLSRQTVRQAIALLEKEGLAQRVRGSGTYVSRPDLPKGPSRNIAVMMTYIGEYIFPDVLAGIEQVLTGAGYTPMLFSTRNRVDNERQILTELRAKAIDGLIVEGTKTALPNPNISLYAELERRGIPMVFINGFYPQLRHVPYVVADDRLGGRMACKYLLEKGCRTIGGIFKSDDIQGHRRYAGYAQALQAAAAPLQDDLVLWYTTENRQTMLDTCAPQLLDQCDGLVCYNDQVALWAVQELQKRGRAGKVEVASFDHSTYARISALPFFSLANPKATLGRLAAEKMLQLLHGQPVRPEVLPWTMEP